MRCWENCGTDVVRHAVKKRRMILLTMTSKCRRVVEPLIFQQGTQGRPLDWTL